MVVRFNRIAAVKLWRPVACSVPGNKSLTHAICSARWSKSEDMKRMICGQILERKLGYLQQV